MSGNALTGLTSGLSIDSPHRAGYVRDADLPKELSIHCARHTLATHLLRKTKNLRQVKKQLGQASPATTANMYADVTFDEMKDGVTGLYDGRPRKTGAAEAPGRRSRYRPV